MTLRHLIGASGAVVAVVAGVTVVGAVEDGGVVIGALTDEVVGAVTGAVVGAVIGAGGVVVSSGTPRLGKVSIVGDDSSRATVCSGATFKYKSTPESNNKNAKSVRGPRALRRSVFATYHTVRRPGPASSSA